MKSGLKDDGAEHPIGTIYCSNLCRDEKRTERLNATSTASFDLCSNLCRDEKRTERHLESTMSYPHLRSNLCRDEKRTESFE